MNSSRTGTVQLRSLAKTCPCLIVLLLGFLSCVSKESTNPQPEETDPYDVHIVSDKAEIRTLSSGEEIKIFRTYTQMLGGERTLVIVYAKKGDLADGETICRESDELLSQFREDIEKSGLIRVSLSRTTMNEKGERTGGLAGETYNRNEDGLWCRKPCVPSEMPEDRCFPIK
jgi:hypothetical protein